MCNPGALPRIQCKGLKFCGTLPWTMCVTLPAPCPQQSGYNNTQLKRVSAQ